VDEQTDKPSKNLADRFTDSTPFNSDTNRSSGRVKTPKATIVEAIEAGKLTEARMLDTLQDLLRDGEVDETEALRLLRWVAHPKRFYVSEQNLLRAVEWSKELAKKLKAEKNPAAAVLTESNPVTVAELLAARNAILEGKLPVAPVASPKPAAIATEKPVKPVPTDDRAEWLKQMIGVGTTWEWKIPEPVVETIRPPNESEQVHLPPIVDGYNPPLPGEGVALTATPAGSFRAGFEKHKNISFEKTDHVGNSIIGNVTVKSPGIPTKVFPKIRQSYFKLWQDHNYEPKYAPDNMREEYRMFLDSLDSTILPSGQNTTPTIEAAGNSTKLDVKVNYPRGMKARRWGTAIDDARKRGPRHVYGESLGTDLAQMYIDADKITGFDL
jgi:hypothetical protein